METTLERPARSDQTALSLPVRAKLALKSDVAEANLRALVLKSADIVAVIDPAGREQAHRMGMNLKTARVDLQKVGKASREDAQAFAKAVIAEENRLIELVAPEEDRILALRDQFDAKVEAERQAAVEKERQRVAGIQADIQRLRDIPLSMVGKPSHAVYAALEVMQTTDMTAERFAEFLPQATAVVTEGADKLSELYQAAVASEQAAEQTRIAQEAEAARVAVEREELARLRAEAAERKRLEDLETVRKQAEENARLQAEREALDRQRKELEAQQAAMRAEQESRDRAAAEAKRLADEEAAAVAEAARQAEIEAENAERDRLQALADQAAVDARSGPAPVEVLIADAYAEPELTDAEIVDCIMEVFSLSRLDAINRLERIDFTGARATLEAS